MTFTRISSRKVCLQRHNDTAVVLPFHIVLLTVLIIFSKYFHNPINFGFTSKSSQIDTSLYDDLLCRTICFLYGKIVQVKKEVSLLWKYSGNFEFTKTDLTSFDVDESLNENSSYRLKRKQIFPRFADASGLADCWKRREKERSESGVLDQAVVVTKFNIRLKFFKHSYHVLRTSSHHPIIYFHSSCFNDKMRRNSRREITVFDLHTIRNSRYTSIAWNGTKRDQSTAAVSSL